MAFRSATSAAGTASAVTNLPVGTVENDYVLLFFTVDCVGTATITWPAGFTNETKRVQAAPDGQNVCWNWKKATAAEPSTYTVSSSLGSFSCLAALSFSGRVSATPISFNVNTNQDTAQTSPTTLTLTGGTALEGDDVIFYAAMDSTGATTTWAFSQPTNFVSRITQNQPDWVSIFLATRDNVIAGATGSVASTATRTGAANAGWTGYLIGISAAPVVVPVTRAKTHFKIGLGF